MTTVRCPACDDHPLEPSGDRGDCRQCGGMWVTEAALAEKLRLVFEKGDEAAQCDAIEAMDLSWPQGAEAVLAAALRSGAARC